LIHGPDVPASSAVDRQRLNLTTKKLKQKREYEALLAHQDISAESKISTYDLYLARPLADSEIIRTCAQILDDVGKEVAGVRKYMPRKFHVRVPATVESQYRSIPVSRSKSSRGIIV